MHLFDAILQRRSHRGDFAPGPISREHLDTLVEAARWAPSPFNVQPWELVFIEDERIKAQVAELTAESIIAQFRDRQFLEANMRWMRLSVNEWQDAGDGVLLEEHISLPGFIRNPAQLRPLLGRVGWISLLGKLGAGKLPAKEFARWVRQSPMLLVILIDWERRCPGESWRDWTLLGLGAMIQNVLLAATALGIGTQFISAPLESQTGRKQIRSLIKAPEHVEPFAMLRLGYTEGSPSHSIRRNGFVHHNTWRETTNDVD